MRRTLGALVAIGALTLAGCGDGLDAPKLATAFGANFARTLIRQEVDLGQPVQSLTAVRAQASCIRGGGVTSGAGDDWLCTVLWVAGDSSHRVAVYDLNVRTDGCFEADGPQLVIGGPTLTDADDKIVSNPLYEFDGCFAVR